MSAGSAKSKTEQLVTAALMIALIVIGTIVLRIPIPMTQGYVHLGDTMIHLSVMVLGKKYGAAAAGIGSAMGDIIGGFAMWAPWSLLIKFLMAYVTGMIIERSGHNRKLLIPAMTAGGLVMCAGYVAAEGIMYGSWALALTGLPWNIGQFAVGILLSLAINASLRHFSK